MCVYVKVCVDASVEVGWGCLCVCVCRVCVYIGCVCVCVRECVCSRMDCEGGFDLEVLECTVHQTLFEDSAFQAL